MQQFKMLVLTDHTNHSSENSLYVLAQAMRQHHRCTQVDVATRGFAENGFFFNNKLLKSLNVTKVDESFAFHPKGLSFKKNLRPESLHSYDVVWLRMPPPLSEGFLKFLMEGFPNQPIINSPNSIYKTGSKEFLMNFPELCPPMKVCRSVEDIVKFKNRFPIVLKPFREYGGIGIVRIDGNKVWEGKNEMIFDDFIKKIKDTKIEYVGVKFLKNVSQGDKRIIVVDGKIMGASLRLPPKDSWICNVAMGGSSNYTEVDKDEVKIVKRINPVLSKLGAVTYGLDTLVSDDGRRVLSELNTTSIGGLPQIAKLMGKPLVTEAVDLICNYIIEKKFRNDAFTN